VKKLIPLVFAVLVCCLGLGSQAKSSISGQNLLTGQPVEIKPGKKGTVVVFMSAKCPCSNSHIGIVKTLVNDFKDFSFVVVHSNMDESVESSKSYFQAAALPVPVIQDGNTQLADQLKAFKTPHAFLFAADGKIVYEGGVTSSAHGPTAEKQFLRDALNDVQADRPVRTPEGRTLGCIISRGEKNVW
jgi:thioredoxin-related protein